MVAGPIIDDRIFGLAPGFRALSIFVNCGDSADGSAATQVLTEACEAVLAGEPAWAEAHLASWGETYLKFGAKPNRTPCSAQALRKRVLKDGRLPAINPVVDLYNAVSLRFAVPVGGENLDAYAGKPHLTIADGSETFDTTMSGEAIVEHPAVGEVIWRDDIGVTCRRWNWRQGSRTRLDALSGRMWFVLEALQTMPDTALDAAGDAMCQGLRALLPTCEIRRHEVSA
ncbi:B3/4 domain-containing protein [Sphingomonas swuensis]|uniref:B3/4 domain-containing protein n=1 Tax=Sphingomonas swuensis TaxID=977800 RepID=A0ABP7S6R6_9SPHN